MTSAASAAWLWRNPLHSDVTLRLCTTQPAAAAAAAAAAPCDEEAASSSQEAHGEAKAQRSATAPTAPEAARNAERVPPAVSYARSYQVHASVLGSCSAYFRKRTTPSASDGAATLQYCDAPAAADGAGGKTTGAALLLVEHVEEGEVQSAEAVLRHCYTAQLCDEGGDESQLTVAALLQMMVLADRFDVPLCLGHCGEELTKRGASAYDIPTVNAVLKGLPPGMHSLPSHAAIVSTATQRLLQLLGDAEAVGDAWFDADSSLDSQLLQLSHPALITLLGSDELMARSENSVLMMADAWVSNSPARAACSETQLRQVAEVVRLGWLSHTFVFDVLPALPWLQLTPRELVSLMRFDAADEERQESLVENDRLAGPAAWYGAPRDPWPLAQALLQGWDIEKADLATLLAKAVSHPESSVASRQSSHWARKRFMNGFVVQQFLCMIMSPDVECSLTMEAQVCKVRKRSNLVKGASSGRKRPWLDLGLEDRWYCLECVPYENVRMIFEVAYKTQGGDRVIHWDYAGVLEYGYHFWQEAMPLMSRSQLLEISSWEPYLVEGKLKLEGTIAQCD